MITITLEVDQTTDLAYHNLSVENKEQLNNDMCILLKNTIANVRSVKLKKLLDEISKESGSKDLNAEILSELLRNED